MISVFEAFEKFRSRLEPGEAEESSAVSKRERVKVILDEQFHLDRIILTGSYKRWTKIKPLRDVDLFCILNAEKEGQYLKGSSRTLLNDFGKKLEEAFGRDNVKIWDKCVTIKFGEPTDDNDNEVFSVDVVPAFEDGNAYKIPDAYHPTGWMKSDPEIHAELATDANKRMDGKWVALVKMAKKCNEFHGKPVDPSFLIEVMALKLFVPPYSGNYKYEIKGFLASVEQQIGNAWPDPAGLGPDVSANMTAAKIAAAKQKLAVIRRGIDNALRHERENRIGDALAAWRNEVFGPMFPLS